MRDSSFLTLMLSIMASGAPAGLSLGCGSESAAPASHADEGGSSRLDASDGLDANHRDQTVTDGGQVVDNQSRSDGRPAVDGSNDPIASDGVDDRSVTDTRDVSASDRALEESGNDRGDSGDTGAGPTPQIPSPPLPSVETDSFSPSSSIIDISDDSAIYANPTTPELSVVIADNKDDITGGVGVFDMQGKLLQFRQDGKIGNVDLRSGFPLAGRSIVLVGGNNRTTDTLIFWQLDPATRQLSAPIGLTIATTSPNYGFCLYHSAATDKFYAFVTQETGTSVMEQYELGEDAGKVSATKVRSFDVGSITEGCVADDEMGRLYVAQEDVALWRYGAEPTAGADCMQVGAVGDGHLVMDLEGVSLARGLGTSGYLVLSLQGDSRFVTYDRETNAFLKEFTVGSNGSIDGVSQTDGLDISTSDLGPGFPKGALVVHDGSNTGGVTSNLKYIPLQ
ncbi:MAG TPA: phytase [Polyangiaceae bacterium]|nr:phytase [Polyangiaceae bacterium]